MKDASISVPSGESLDCALALQELADMGVSNIITFDAHDPRVANSVPLSGFDSYMPTYQFLKALIQAVPDFIIDNEHLMIISPDEGAMGQSRLFLQYSWCGYGYVLQDAGITPLLSMERTPSLPMNFWEILWKEKTLSSLDDMISSGRKYAGRCETVKRPESTPRLCMYHFWPVHRRSC